MKAPLVLALAVAVAAGTACRRPERSPEAEPLDAFFAKQGLTRSQAWGRHLFEARCAACHGATGRGDGKNAYTLEPPPPDFGSALSAHPPSYWRQVITGGTASVGRSPLCPAWGRALTADDVDGLVAYLERLAKQPPPRGRTRRGRVGS